MVGVATAYSPAADAAPHNSFPTSGVCPMTLPLFPSYDDEMPMVELLAGFGISIHITFAFESIRAACNFVICMQHIECVRANACRICINKRFMARRNTGPTWHNNKNRRIYRFRHMRRDMENAPMCPTIDNRICRKAAAMHAHRMRTNNCSFSLHKYTLRAHTHTQPLKW